jgi:response regulator RpfG family c-di-GMP phosphodiesterase
LRCRRVYKPALAHLSAVQIMTQASVGQFDPALIQVFNEVAPQFDKIFQDNPD